MAGYSNVWAKVMWPNNFIVKGNVTNTDGYSEGANNTIHFKQTIEYDITNTQGLALKQMYQASINNLTFQYPDVNTRPPEVQADIDKMQGFIDQITTAQNT